MLLHTYSVTLHYIPQLVRALFFGKRSALYTKISALYTNFSTLSADKRFYV